MTAVVAVKEWHNGTLLLQCACPSCGKTTDVVVSQRGWFDYFVNKQHVQLAFPKLNADERELIVSGFCSLHDPFNNLHAGNEE